MNHKERRQQMFEVIKMATFRGLGLRKTGHQFQVYSEKLGTLFQSHDIMEVKEWIRYNKEKILTPPATNMLTTISAQSSMVRL